MGFFFSFFFLLNKSFVSVSNLPPNYIDKQGVTKRCDFEQGTCYWAQSGVDTPESEWTRHKAQEAWPNYGPPRDHTQNSDAGLRLYELLNNGIIHMSLHAEINKDYKSISDALNFSVLSWFLCRSLHYTCCRADYEGPDF